MQYNAAKIHKLKKDTMASSKSAITGTIWLKPVTNQSISGRGTGDLGTGDIAHCPYGVITFKFLLKSVCILAHFQFSHIVYTVLVHWL